MVIWVERVNMAKVYDVILQLRIQKDLRERFNAYSEKTGISQSDYLRSFIQDLVNGKFESKTRYLGADRLTDIRKR